MAPKASTSSPLGPLAKRTFKATPTPSSTPPHLSPSTPSAPPPFSPSQVPHSPSRPASSPPLLLPRNDETSLHRRLRSLLLDFTRHRKIWEEEILEMGEAVGRYASTLNEMEEEIQEWKASQGRRKGKERLIQVDRHGGSDGDTVAMGHFSPSITELFRTLHDIYTRNLFKGRERIEKATESLVRYKDSARALQGEWTRLSEEGGLSEEQGDVRWGRRGGDEFVEAVSYLTLQAQVQCHELIQSLDILLVDCSPLGSLHSVPDGLTSAELPSKNTKRSMYNPQEASKKRKEILLLWRDLSSLDRGGEGSFEWWEDVWKAEVRGWEES